MHASSQHLTHIHIVGRAMSIQYVHTPSFCNFLSFVIVLLLLLLFAILILIYILTKGLNEGVPK